MKPLCFHPAKGMIELELWLQTMNISLITLVGILIKNSRHKYHIYACSEIITLYWRTLLDQSNFDRTLPFRDMKHVDANGSFGKIMSSISKVTLVIACTSCFIGNWKSLRKSCSDTRLKENPYLYMMITFSKRGRFGDNCAKCNKVGKTIFLFYPQW